MLIDFAVDAIVADARVVFAAPVGITFFFVDGSSVDFPVEDTFLFVRAIQKDNTCSRSCSGCFVFLFVFLLPAVSSPLERQE